MKQLNGSWRDVAKHVRKALPMVDSRPVITDEDLLACAGLRTIDLPTLRRVADATIGALKAEAERLQRAKVGLT